MATEFKNHENGAKNLIEEVIMRLVSGPVMFLKEGPVQIGCKSGRTKRLNEVGEENPARINLMVFASAMMRENRSRDVRRFGNADALKVELQSLLLGEKPTEMKRRISPKQRCN
eukprot:1634717-Amphidinium_carterae.1